MGSFSSENRAPPKNPQVNSGDYQGARSRIPWFDCDNNRTACLKVANMADLGETVELLDESWALSLYKDVVDQDDIDAFLADPTSGYVRSTSRDGRWASLPTDPQEEENLQGSDLCTLLSNILQTLGDTGGDGVSREVVNSHGSSLPPHLSDGHFPRVSVRATGPSFEVPDRLEQFCVGTGYSNLASVFEVYLNKYLWDDVQQVAQVALFCK